MNPATYTVGVAITANTPTSSGGAVVSYSVSPALPAGLSLNTSTGVISGTPTTVTTTASYTITATNPAGSTTAGITITVNASVTPPSGLTYSTNPATYTVGVAVTANTPSSGGGAVASYSVSPALPAGLSLNTTTGVISGTPTSVASAATYTVTAANSAGSATAGVVITVNAAVVAPTGLTYSVNPASYTVGLAITPNAPSSSGGAVTSYSVSPALPAGLSLNTSTGVISGTPTAVTASATYSVTATNSAGSTNVNININVISPPPVASVMVAPSSATLSVSSTCQLAVATLDSSGAVVTGRSIVWGSSSPTVATVSTDGLVTALSAGTTTVSATSDGKIGNATITVTAVAVASVTLSPNPATIEAGMAGYFTVVLRDASGATLTDPRIVNWASGNPSIASVTVQGLVSGISAGTTTISATSEGKVGTATLIVTPPPTSLCSQIAGATVYGYDQLTFSYSKYLGRLTNKYDPQSLNNESGLYGSSWNSETSVYCTWGPWGSTWSLTSAWNQVAINPPILVKNGTEIAYLTVNQSKGLYVTPAYVRTCSFP